MPGAIAELFPVFPGGGDHSQHDVGMTIDVFGGGLNRHIRTMDKWIEKNRGSPGVVHD